MIERRNAMETEVAVKFEAHEHEIGALKHRLKVIEVRAARR
jgi:hypothetical protein